jgi:hypothetical protein
MQCNRVCNQVECQKQLKSVHARQPSGTTRQNLISMLRGLRPRSICVNGVRSLPLVNSMQGQHDTSLVPTMNPTGFLRMKRLPPWHNKRSSAKKSA